MPKGGEIVALFVWEVDGWLDKHPELDDRKGQILRDVLRDADAEGAIGSRAVTRIMGRETSDQLFRELFERRNY